MIGSTKNSKFIFFIRNCLPYRIFRFLREYAGWIKRDFRAPSPSLVKHRTLLRNGFSNATWVETGTYLGQTTFFYRSMVRLYIALNPNLRFFRMPLLTLSSIQMLKSKKD
jgi:hypothetical protein